MRNFIVAAVALVLVIGCLTWVSGREFGSDLPMPNFVTISDRPAVPESEKVSSIATNPVLRSGPTGFETKMGLAKSGASYMVVAPLSPQAREAGAMAGDLIVALGNDMASDADTNGRILSAAEESGAIAVTVLRNNRRVILNWPLVDRTAQ
jgi:S1-C subfamily serine protease